MLKTRLCDYSNAYTLVKRAIIHASHTGAALDKNDEIVEN